MKFLLRKKNLKTEMNLYSIESIHLKTSKGKKKKWKERNEQTYQYKKVLVGNLRMRTGEDALLLSRFIGLNKQRS